jgi:Flp pilus assembly protein TadG
VSLRLTLVALRRGRNGSVVTEFALVTPLMSMLLLGTIEFGSVMYAYSAMQMGASVAARQIAVNLASPATAQSRALQIVPSWARADVNTSITQSNAGDPGTNMIRVRMVATSDRLGVIALMSRLAPLPITAEVTVKQELPYVD